MPKKPHPNGFKGHLTAQDDEIKSPMHVAQTTLIEIEEDVSIVNDLADCNLNYIVTKEEAKNTIILEPDSQAKISLFDYFINVIRKEYSKLKNHPHYANEAKLLLDELNNKLINAASNDDIKKIIRVFLNQQDLHANLNSLETF